MCYLCYDEKFINETLEAMKDFDYETAKKFYSVEELMDDLNSGDENE
jgi:hypothetical protein